MSRIIGKNVLDVKWDTANHMMPTSHFCFSSRIDIISSKTPCVAYSARKARNNMSIARYLTETAANYPDRCAIVYEGKRWNYAEYESMANGMANAFASLAEKGDRIAIFNTNCPEHLFCLFAAAKIGAMYSPLNCRLRGAELSHVLSDCRPALVLVGRRYAEQVTAVTGKIATNKRTLIIDAPHGEFDSLHDFVKEADDSVRNAPVSENEIALLMYTSGTTGAHKGVMYSHGSLMQRCESRKTAYDDPALEKTMLLVVPIFHITGMQLVVKTAASAGTLVIMPQFEVEKFLQIIEQESVTAAFVVPTMIEQIVEYPGLEKYDLESLRILVYGGAPASPDLIRKAMRKLHCAFIQGYGLTEASVTWLQPSEHQLDLEAGKHDLLQSVGKAVAGVEIAIVDDADKRLPPGQTGEILGRGTGVMQGYWQRDEDTARCFRNGWFRTGDLGFLDEEGYLFVTGRKKDLIIRGGENIAPLEVENVLTSHSAIAEAAVFGIPDARWGEIVAAAVVLKPSQEVKPEQLIEFCRQRIASYKKPERIFFLRSLPRNAAGKVVRAELKKICQSG
jgi:acyl-CoA synthetase (AMP-forming)/AMP-acid ligase II